MKAYICVREQHDTPTRNLHPISDIIFFTPSLSIVLWDVHAGFVCERRPAQRFALKCLHISLCELSGSERASCSSWQEQLHMFLINSRLPAHYGLNRLVFPSLSLYFFFSRVAFLNLSHTAF